MVNNIKKRFNITADSISKINDLELKIEWLKIDLKSAHKMENYYRDKMYENLNKESLTDHVRRVY